jgi:tetratricopeptide (TPR) repeat protein
MKLIKKIQFSSLSVLLSLAACGPGVVQNNKGTRAFGSEDYLTAREHYVGALLENPDSKHYRYNLAIANTAGERLSDALKELDVIESSYKGREVLDAELEDIFKLYFAKAFLHALTQNIDEALEYYQKALFIKPDSLDVKKNIELLIQKEKSQKGKDGKPSKDKKDGGKKGDKSDNKGENKDSKGKDKDKKDLQGQDDETLKKKNLTKEEIKQILKEIKDQESKVRAKESQKNKGQKRGKGANGKTW